MIVQSIKKLGWIRRLGCFDYYGISRFAPKFYDPLLWDRPPQEQARWADASCVANADSPPFIDHIMNYYYCRIMMKDENNWVIDSSTIGNLAYLVTSSSVPVEYREKIFDIANLVGKHYCPYEKFKNADPESLLEPFPYVYHDNERIDYFEFSQMWLHSIWAFLSFLTTEYMVYVSLPFLLCFLFINIFNGNLN